MRQLKRTATYSRRRGAPQNSATLNRNTRQHDTANWRQSFVVTEIMSASINNYNNLTTVSTADGDMVSTA